MELKVGDKVGFLVLQSIASSMHRGCSWRCLCVCGAEVVHTASRLKMDRPHNCGCKTKELLSARTRTHGMGAAGKQRSREYSTYYAMKSRCLYPIHKEYKNYGGRGIKICDRWLESFENFIEDMGECPQGFTLDRKDPDGDYDLSNCRWASWRDQSRNKRNTVWVEFEGERIQLRTLSDKFGIPRSRAYARWKMGWPVARIVEK